MDIAQVVDRDTLREYLAALPEPDRREVGLRVAYCAAVRVLPIAAQWFLTDEQARKLDLTPVAMFGAILISGVARKIPTPEIAAAAAAASAASAAFASDASASAAAAFASDASASDASASAAFALSDFDLWPLIRDDLRGDVPLWPDGMPDVLQTHWADAVAAMQNHPADWSIWIHWYNRVLQNRDWHPKVMSAVLEKITREDWDKGPTHINPMFDEVLGLYLEEDVAQLISATPLAEDVVYDPPTQTLSLQPRDRVDEEYLTDIRAQIVSACDIFGSATSPTNAFAALAEEVGILRDAMEKHHARPVLILKAVSRVLGRLERKAKTGECPTPDQDANVYDFRSVLLDIQLDLIALSPEVRKYHEATRPILLTDVVPVAVGAAKSVGAVSDPELREVLDAESAVVDDAGQDDIARRNAFYRIAGLVARAYRAVRGATKEGASFAKDFSIIAGTVTAGGGGIFWFFSPAFRETLAALLRSFGI